MSEPELLGKRFAAECPGAFFLDANNVASLAHYLHAAGLLTFGERISRVAKAGEGNMNLTLRVETDTRSFIIKQSRPWVEKYPQLAAPWDRVLHEAKFYELTSAAPSVAGRMPRVLAVDPVSRVLVLEDLGDAGDFSALYQGARLSPTDLSRLAEYLSQLHRLEFDGATRATLTNRELRQLNHAHIFKIPLLAENGLDLDAILPGLANAAAVLKNDPVYLRTATELGLRYLADGPTLLHGDFFPGSWLSSGGELKVIDPEFSHFGCVEFEIGVLRAHLILTGHDEKDWETFLNRYPISSDFEMKLMHQFAGLEMMRRIIGYAQLPLTAGLTQKKSWLALSWELVLS